MAERVTLTRKANNGQAMTVREIAELGQAWMLAQVPGDVVPMARTSDTGLWSLTVTYDPDQSPVAGPPQTLTISRPFTEADRPLLDWMREQAQEHERARMRAALWGAEISPNVDELAVTLQSLGFRLPTPEASRG